MTEARRLEEIAAVCRNRGAYVRYHADLGYLTALYLESGGPGEAYALSVQQQIEQMTAQYPGLVCYRFDPYSTLVYTIRAKKS